MKVDIYHNIRWSKYKAAVFSELYQVAEADGVKFDFCQIADTEGDRVGLAGVDLSYHQYPYELLYSGSYSQVPRFRMMRDLFSRVLRSDADLVLLPGYHRAEFWGMLAASLLTGKRRAVFCDSTINDRSQSFIKGIAKRIFFRACHGYLGYGRRAAEYLAHYGADPRHIYARCQAAALPHSYREGEALARRTQMAGRSSRFLYVGRLSPEKGLETLIRAFASVCAELEGAILVLVGSGPQREQLEALVKSLNLVGAVEFAGSMDVDHLAEQYASATCLVLPSTSEPWGLVVNEALHYGCPVLVSDRCGCVPELVVDGVTGYVFRSDDVADLASKLLKMSREFSDPCKAARACLDQIRTYTPRRAALEILKGCRAIGFDGGLS